VAVRRAVGSVGRGLSFVACGGWHRQGIVPFKRVKFARKATQLMTTKLITVAEMLERLEPHRMVTPNLNPYYASSP
jgi:hypothetical protein